MLGKALLVPLAIAVFVWILIGAIKSTLVRLAPGNMHVPGWISNALAILIIVATTYAAIGLIASQSDELAAAIPVYQANFAAIVANLTQSLNIQNLPSAESCTRSRT